MTNGTIKSTVESMADSEEKQCAVCPTSKGTNQTANYMSKQECDRSRIQETGGLAYCDVHKEGRKKDKEVNTFYQASIYSSVVR